MYFFPLITRLMQTDGGVQPVQGPALHPLLCAAAVGRLLVLAVRAVPAALGGAEHHAYGQQLVRAWGHEA